MNQSEMKSRIVPMMQQSIRYLIEAVNDPAQAETALTYAHDVLELIDLKAQTMRKLVPDHEYAAAYLNGGMSVVDIASQYQVSPTTVNSALDRLKIKRRARSTGPAPGRDVAKRAKVVEMWNLGQTLEEIGTPLNITRERVRQLLKEEGIDTSKRPLKPEEKLIVQEYIDGASLWDIGERHDITGTRLRTLIRRAGYQVRPSPRSGRRQPHTLLMAEKAAKLYREGKPVDEIAKLLKVASGGPVYRWLAIAGVMPNRNFMLRPRKAGAIDKL